MKSQSLSIALIFSIYQFAFQYQGIQGIMDSYKRMDLKGPLHLLVIMEQLVHTCKQTFSLVCPH